MRKYLPILTKFGKIKLLKYYKDWHKVYKRLLSSTKVFMKKPFCWAPLKLNNLFKIVFAPWCKQSRGNVHVTNAMSSLVQSTNTDGQELVFCISKTLLDHVKNIEFEKKLFKLFNWFRYSWFMIFVTSDKWKLFNSRFSVIYCIPHGCFQNCFEEIERLHSRSR